MKHYIEYLLLLMVYFTVGLLSESSARRFSHFVKWIMFKLIRYRRRVALRNLKESFPEKSSEELYAILEGAYENFAIVGVELLRQKKLRNSGAVKRVKFSGSEMMEKLKEKNNAAIIASGHAGNWELLGGAIAQSGIVFTGIADHMSNKYSDKLFEGLRRSLSQKIFYTSEPSTRLLKLLKDGTSLGIATDQDSGKSGVFVDFFGRKASMPKGAAYLALKSGFPIVMLFSRRLEDGSYEAEIDPILIESGLSVTEENIRKISQTIASRLEEHIRKNPGQWLWFHRRWKTRPEGEQEKKRLLILQTAFLGDVVLATPIAEEIKKAHPSWEIDFLTIPQAASLVKNNPNISEVIEYDKRDGDSGFRGFFNMVRRIETGAYDIAIVPHRSIRSAALVRLSGIPSRIGFDRSAGSFLLTEIVKYEDNIHEVDRNLKLLDSIIDFPVKGYPRLYPAVGDVRKAENTLTENGISSDKPLVAIAPGSIWNTKRWPIDKYEELARKFIKNGANVILIGGKDDISLLKGTDFDGTIDLAGKLTLMESAALLKKCDLLVTNDSAPMHFAVGVDTPVVAIFGATAPKYGFYPYDKDDIVVERELPCRPCAIHGGTKCPIGTFECMLDISAEEVYSAAKSRIELEERTLR
ncbi:MAG: lipopolysaccharide heptosyltransferase II [Candidatus Marinimicrobia bacterium]|nr:lipopolysaccharide heptosyltransferase II [Candidatus Neomarinimicrobiota bacterium]